MPKVTIRFNLPEEQAEYNITSKAGKMHSGLLDFDNYLRSEIKHGTLTYEESEIYNKIRSKLWECIDVFSDLYSN